MRTYMDRGILLLFGIMGYSRFVGMSNVVVCALVGLILATVFCYLEDEKGKSAFIVKRVLYMGSFVASFILPRAIFILPVVIYSYFYENRMWKNESGLFLLLFGGSFFACHGALGAGVTCFYIGMAVMGVLLGEKDGLLCEKEEEIKVNRDNATELLNALKEKNTYLASNQEKEIHIATLSERNRIAREIHDNVGHMLTRSILQLGAIMVVHKQEPVREELEPLKESLDVAMNNIRESVHDLHKESFDVKAAAEKLLAELSDYEVEYRCTISLEADKEIKYAFITILKEAITNIRKHSNATKINVDMLELSDYYQMLVEDNGTGAKNIGHIKGGIGLSNMEERARNLGGIFTVSGEKGFRIFVSVPKTQEEK
ncbi:MAG: sensor histidine kinase [Lachnospiraceae bacterium]|nr:sensor histidine kinase [Lachnospiraceae bacterium]